MAKFDYKDALERGCTTRDGRKVKDLAYMPSGERYQLVGVINGEVVAWCIDGRHYPGEASALDLVNLPKEHWVNFYDHDGNFYDHDGDFNSVGKAYSSEKEAREAAADGARLAKLVFVDE